MPVFLLPCMSALQENLSRRQILRRGLAATGALALAGAAYEVLSAVEFPPTIDSATGIETYEFNINGQRIDASNYSRWVGQMEAKNTNRPDGSSLGIIRMSVAARNSILAQAQAANTTVENVVKNWVTLYNNRRQAAGMAPTTNVNVILVSDLDTPEYDQPDIYTNNNNPLYSPKNFDGIVNIGGTKLPLNNGTFDITAGGSNEKRVLQAFAETVDRFPDIGLQNCSNFDPNFVVPTFFQNGFLFNRNSFLYGNDIVVNRNNTSFGAREQQLAANEDGTSRTAVHKARSINNPTGSINRVRMRPYFIATSGAVNSLDPVFISRIEFRVAKFAGTANTQNQFTNTPDLIQTPSDPNFLSIDLAALQPTDANGRKLLISGGHVRFILVNGVVLDGLWGYDEVSHYSVADRQNGQEPTDESWDMNLIRGTDNPGWDYVFNRGTRVKNATRNIATPTPTPSPSATITPTPSESPSPSPSPSRTPTPSPSASPSRTATPTQTSTATQEPGIPTNTPGPDTPTPEPPTPTPGEVSTPTPVVERPGYGAHLKLPKIVLNGDFSQNDQQQDPKKSSSGW